MCEPGNGPRRRRRSAVRSRRREAQLLDAFESPRRSDRRVQDALVTIIRHGDVRILQAVSVIVSCVLRATRSRAQRGANHVAPVPRSPR